MTDQHKNANQQILGYILSVLDVLQDDSDQVKDLTNQYFTVTASTSLYVLRFLVLWSFALSSIKIFRYHLNKYTSCLPLFSQRNNRWIASVTF
ncbi:MAG: hypothetical protein AAGK47_10160, partial [Bacteroidota bacterium]